MPRFSPITQTMVQAARTAGQVLLSMQNNNLSAIKKGKLDFATEADLKAQEALSMVLQQSCPDIPLVAEEQKHPRIPPKKKPFFTGDPLDNTKRYKKGYKAGWGTILGYVEDGEPVAGVILLPAERQLFVAERGQGCFLNGRPVRLNSAVSLDQAVIDIEVGPWLDEHCLTTAVGPLVTSTTITHSCETVVGVDILRHLVDLWVFVRGRNNKGGGIWDFTAPAICVQEAGGVVCDPHGQPLRFDHIDMNGVVYAANKEIATQAVRLMRRW